MRKRKEKTNPSETLAAQKIIIDGDDEKGVFFACYLLTSLSPRHKGHTYIGFTVNPRRRIRQHNGEIGCGAVRTKRKRPWEMVMCIYGFPTNVSALQFEWAWQHPKESLAVRNAAAELKLLSGVSNKIKLAYTMLTLPSWQSLSLTVNFFSTKYTTHCASCPSLPQHMKVQVHSMGDLPCYGTSANCSYEDEYDLAADEEVNCPSSLLDIMSGETDAACPNSSDDQNDQAENGTMPDSGKEKRLSSDTSDTLASSFNMDEFVNERLFQMPTDSIRDCTLDGRLTLETGASSRQLPTDEKFWSILEETSTWDSYGFARQRKNSCDLLDSTLPRSPSLSSIQDYVKDLGAGRLTKKSNIDKSMRASGVIDSSAQVEVIDIMTPSPDCRVSILSKKRRAPVYPSIIDLTRSPNFVQL